MSGNLTTRERWGARWISESTTSYWSSTIPREARIRANSLPDSPDLTLIYAYTLFVTEGSLLVTFIRGVSLCPYAGLNSRQTLAFNLFRCNSL
ncbi:hypothetical protein BDV41DRAFT_524070, partial [Aspergillus transmontanensis]